MNIKTETFEEIAVGWGRAIVKWIGAHRDLLPCRLNLLLPGEHNCEAFLLAKIIMPGDIFNVRAIWARANEPWNIGGIREFAMDVRNRWPADVFERINTSFEVLDKDLQAGN